MRGVIPRTLEDVFISLDCMAAKNEVKQYTVHLSALEVYKEQVKDLLHKDLKVFARTARVVGTEVGIASAVQGLKVMEGTKQNRQIGRTAMNAESQSKQTTPLSNQ